MKGWVLLVALLLSPVVPLRADFVFSEVDPGIPGVTHGAVAWADYDGDDDLDLLVTGYDARDQPSAALYRNQGGDRFVSVATPFPGVGYSAVAWHNMDRDDDPDLVLLGRTNGGKETRVFRNEGVWGFVDMQANLPGLDRASAAWGDYDRDGDADLLLAGDDGRGKPVSRLYRNNGDGTFTEIAVKLPGVADGQVLWEDFDGDGWLDILLTGRGWAPLPDGTFPGVTCLLFGDGEGRFVKFNSGLPPLADGTAAAFDADGDGYVELILSGAPLRALSTSPFADMFRRGAGGAYRPVNAGLEGLWMSRITWGDIDQDGQVDLLLTGESGQGSDRVPRLDYYAGDKVRGYRRLAVAIPAVRDAATAWGDYDGDGDLDLVLTGRFDDGEPPRLRLYRNESLPAAGAPRRPVDLQAAVDGNAATLSWSRDPSEPAAQPGRTFNVRVGSVPRTSDVLSAMAHERGALRLPRPGNAGDRLSLTLTGLPRPGTYYWTVQTVSADFVGSSFAGQASFVVTSAAEPPAVRLIQAAPAGGSSAVFVGDVRANGLPTRAWFEFGIQAVTEASTPSFWVGTDLGWVTLHSGVESLAWDQRYQCRLAASNQLGMAFTEIRPLDFAVKMTRAEVAPNGRFDLDFPGWPGEPYTVQVSTDLEEWQDLGPAAEEASGQFIYRGALLEGESPTFYRVRGPARSQ